MTTRNLLLLAAFVSAAPARAQNDSGPAAAPEAVWRFDGNPDVGPRPPTYPAFPADNAALALTGKGLTVREADRPDARLRFGNGDAVTLEAWVRVKELKEGAYAYLIGKGRTGRPGFPEKNQNYALRLKRAAGEAKVSFLFASAAATGKPADWHRWTSTTGFPVNDGWHHVAVTYTFGRPKSIKGYVDGRSVPGTWDMAGATDRAPAADADDLTIGGGNGGSAGNAFHGWLDEVAVWRTALPESVLTDRYQFVPPPPAVNRADLPRGRVLVQLCENATPGRNAWPETPPAVSESYREDVFGFFEAPHKYVGTGVRGDRGHPFLLRAAAVVDLPAGKHRLLLRARGASRLYLDGKLLLTTPFPPGNGDGHGEVAGPEAYLNLGPDFRFAPPGNRETWTTVETRGGEQLVVLETIVGSYLGKSRRRPELGETVVAVSRQGSRSWEVLSPGTRTVPYTDAGWAAYEAERTAHYDRVNADRRAALREQHKGYWDRRRAAARQWLASTAEVKVPDLPAGFPAHNPIDHFLAAKIVGVAAQEAEAKKGSVDYFRDVQPILEAKCYDCHAGAKVKGGLRLDDRAAALKGGKADGPAVTPGRPAESALLTRVAAKEGEVMPPKGERLTAGQVKVLETWVREGARWPDVKPERTALTPLADDLTFLRRVTLDTVGVVPTPEEIAAFLGDKSPDRRARVIDRLLADPRWADHWMGYWQDVLAENPNIINPTLNNTGPFRWWIYESLRDNKPLDLFVTELVRMEGSARFGGPAGFGVAAQNDSPFATKGMILAGAFLGVEMKCARCHDAPAHRSTQEDLFRVAAMLGTKPLTVPVTSSVPLDKIHQGGRTPLIQVTLKPGTAVQPGWPFGGFVDETVGTRLAEHPADPRDRLAALLTAPENERFAQVMANRIWRRFMGRGLVEPVDDWEKGKPTHPELLRWLGRELVRGGYDTKRLARLILTSHAYQRATDKALKAPGVLYAAPAPRRLTAEQIVDSLFVATGKPMKLEEVSLDIDGHRDLNASITLGKPRRAWMLTSTSNERDRPSLALPCIQAVTDVLQAFGWRGARQEPTSYRDESPNALQPAILSNGTMGVWLTRLSDDHGVTDLAVRDQPVDQLLDGLVLKLLTRKPTAAERAAYAEHLKVGYETRVRTSTPMPAGKRQPEPYVSWSNHLAPEATVVRQQQEQAARKGDPPTDRLDREWRARLEDVLWAVLNSPEFVFAP